MSDRSLFYIIINDACAKANAMGDLPTDGLNMLAYLNALHSGNIPALSWADRKLMRFVYVRKYAKKK